MNFLLVSPEYCRFGAAHFMNDLTGILSHHYVRNGVTSLKLTTSSRLASYCFNNDNIGQCRTTKSVPFTKQV